MAAMEGGHSRLEKLWILAGLNPGIARISFNLVLSERRIIARPLVSNLTLGFQRCGCFFLGWAGFVSLSITKAIQKVAGSTRSHQIAPGTQGTSSPLLFHF